MSALGISRMKCRCSYTESETLGVRYWSFESEPRIQGVDRDGPAHGTLKPGDAMVAIDGLLITTHDAGRRFANISVGEPVELTVRRRGSLVDLSIVATAPADEDDAVVEALGRPLSEDLLELRQVLEELSEAGVELDSLSATPESTGLSDPAQPLGWFGFGLSFGGSRRRLPEGKGARWEFFSPPVVQSVTPDGPAYRAGLQPNDVLTHIDGVRLDTKRGGGIFSRVAPGQTVEFEVERDGWTRTFVIVVDERPRN
jgi:predicted metalloprotease with PDZ domain